MRRASRRVDRVALLCLLSGICLLLLLVLGRIHADQRQQLVQMPGLAGLERDTRRNHPVIDEFVCDDLPVRFLLLLTDLCRGHWIVDVILDLLNITRSQHPVHILVHAVSDRHTADIIQFLFLRLLVRFLGQNRLVEIGPVPLLFPFAHADQRVLQRQHRLRGEEEPALCLVIDLRRGDLDLHRHELTPGSVRRSSAPSWPAVPSGPRRRSG